MADVSKYYICTADSNIIIECLIYGDVSKAHEYFEDKNNQFANRHDQDRFEGEYQNFYEDDYGYIVVDGVNLGTGIFGDLYVNGNEVYAGLYYADNVVLIVRPRDIAERGKVEEIISILGLPKANGV